MHKLEAFINFYFRDNMENESVNFSYEEPNVNSNIDIDISFDLRKIDMFINGEKCGIGEVATMRAALGNFANFLSKENAFGAGHGEVLRKDYLKNVNSMFAKMKID